MNAFVVHHMAFGGEERSLRAFSDFYAALYSVAKYIAKFEPEISLDLKTHGARWEGNQSLTFVGTDNIYVSYKLEGESFELCWGDSKQEITFVLSIHPVTIDSMVKTIMRKGMPDGNLHFTRVHD